MDTESSSRYKAPRRRNGMRQACQPCRRRKLACDHSLPTCNRCQRSRSGQRCNYEASQCPDALPGHGQHRRDVPSVEGSLSTLSPAIAPNREHGSTPTSRTGDIASTGASGSSGNTPALSSVQELLNPPASYWQHTQESIWTGDEDLEGNEGAEEDSMRRNLQILRCIPDVVTSRILLGKNRNIIDGWVRPAVLHMADSILKTFGQRDHDQIDSHQARELLQVLSNNRRHVLKEEQTDTEEWLASISGPNLRWEGLGILFVHWALGTLHWYDDSHLSIHQEKGERQWRFNAVSKYLACIDRCLELCGRRSSNTLILYLLIKHSYVSSVLYGDTNLSSTRLLAEANCILTGLALQSLPSTDQLSLPFQIRCRLFAHVFICDKVGSIFTRQPPVLAGRFCSTPLPLDISDEMLMRLGRQSTILDRSAIEVDEAGWNTKGKIYPTTVMRARLLMAYVRDEILEIAMSVNMVVDADRLDQLLQRQKVLYLKLPYVMKWSTTHRGDEEIEDVNVHYGKMFTRLEHLQNVFFILRLLKKARSELGDAVELLQVSYEMLDTTLAFWIKPDSPRSNRSSLDWFMVSYGCPAAGLLANELLQPNVCLAGSGVRRSDIVQKLTLLNTFIDWGGPEVPNKTLLVGVREVIRSVLAQILDERHDPSGTLTSAAQTGPGFPDGIDFDINWNDYFAFELLDTFGWVNSQDL